VTEAGRRGSSARASEFVVGLGVVFCGGESRRMGRDKALLEVRGSTLLERAVACLSAVVSEVVLACGAQDRYQRFGRERVLDRRPGMGPLAGLEAALCRMRGQGTDPERSILYALACDMPMAEPEVFRALCARLGTSGSDAVLLSSERGVEPLYGVYRASVLPAVERALERGDQRLVSFHGEIAVARLDRSELGGSFAEACATNVNTPEEFRAVGGSFE